ncbi:MAG: biotin-dependent carboxyltransferase [Chloroflexi bacterium]|nr:biotin-dependent carboxyltransferase [Chloroflexota bacterium]
MGRLRVVSPGPLTTTQDQGRFGYSRYGVSISGAADTHALTIGNMLVGNPANAAAIEVTFGATEFEFLDESVFALTGADLAASFNGAPAPLNQTIAAIPSDRVSFQSPKTGFRAYLCLAGGVDVPPTLGSRSTYLAAGIGGHEGRALRTDDVLHTGLSDRPVHTGRRASPSLLPRYGADITVRVIAGPQSDRFSETGLKIFYSSAYTVTDKSDRQGVRLDGPIIEAVAGYDIVSDAVVTGAVQVPGDGKPIVLLADRQTTGGYPKIGVVATVDVPLLAQVTPGSVVRFHPISVEEAQDETRRAIAALAAAVFEEPELQVTEMLVDGVPYRLELALPQAPARHLRATALVNGVRRVVGAEVL